MNVYVSFLTGFKTSRVTQTVQLPKHLWAFPLLPLILTFRSLRSARMGELSIPLISLPCQFVTSVSMVTWAIRMGCNFRTTLCEAATTTGRFTLLKWSRGQTPPWPWDAEMCAHASIGGHFWRCCNGRELKSPPAPGMNTLVNTLLNVAGKTQKCCSG